MNMLAYTVVITVDQNLQKVFWSWMEGLYLKEIWQTELFRKITVQKPFKEDDRKEFLNKVMYYPKDMDSWEKYKTEHQPKIFENFEKEFKEYIEDGKIKTGQIFGFEQVLFTSI